MVTPTKELTGSTYRTKPNPAALALRADAELMLKLLVDAFQLPVGIVSAPVSVLFSTNPLACEDVHCKTGVPDTDGFEYAPPVARAPTATANGVKFGGTARVSENNSVILFIAAFVPSGFLKNSAIASLVPYKGAKYATL